MRFGIGLCISLALWLSGCSESPVELPLTEPARFAIMGDGQCTESGSLYPAPVSFVLENYDDAPVPNRLVLISISGGTISGPSNQLKDADGRVNLIVRADSIPLPSMPSGNVALEVRVADRPTVVGAARLSATPKSWLRLTEPDSALICRDVATGRSTAIAVNVDIDGVCGQPFMSSTHLRVAADDLAAGSFHQVGDIAISSGHGSELVSIRMRPGMITMLVYEPDMHFIPNRVTIVVQQCR